MGWMRALPDGKPISALGFGCSSRWAGPGFEEARARAILDAAAAGGINHFDTSPSYGAGTGERRLGAFLGQRDPAGVVVSTKVGNNLVAGELRRGFARDDMRRSLDGSLARLGLERVDALYLHGPAPDELTDEVFRFFEDEKAAGRVGLAGLESQSAAVVEAAIRSPLDIVMLHYSVGDQARGRAIERLHAAGKLIVSGTTLAQGTFSLSTFLPTSRDRAWYLARAAKNDPLFWWHGPRLARRLARVPGSPHDAAIRFVTGHPLILSGLFGSSSAAHVMANAAAGHGALTAEQRALLTRGREP